MADIIDLKGEILLAKQRKLTERYLQETAGWECLYCQGEEIERDFSDHSYDGGGSHKCTVTCSTCGKSWIEEWFLGSIQTDEINREFHEYWQDLLSEWDSEEPEED